MLVFTHMLFANFLLNEYDGLQEGSFPLDRMGFRFGNILPDISSMAKRGHYFDETQDFITYYQSRVSDTTLGSWDRSVALGVLCHFQCDYFCKYHHFSALQKKSILIHLAYELKLHLAFLAINLNIPFQHPELKLTKLSIEKQLMSTNRLVHMNMSTSYTSNFNLRPTFKDTMLNLYKQQKNSLRKDLVFSLLSSKHIISQYLYVVLVPKTQESLEEIFQSAHVQLSSDFDMVLG